MPGCPQRRRERRRREKRDRQRMMMMRRRRRKQRFRRLDSYKEDARLIRGSEAELKPVA